MIENEWELKMHRVGADVPGGEITSPHGSKMKAFHLQRLETTKPQPVELGLRC